MKKQILSYSFDASAQTIEFDDYATIRLDSVLLITNVTDNIIIYNFADTSKGGTAATNILTLDYDTTAMDDTDDLLIYYDDPDVSSATEAKQDDIKSSIDALGKNDGDTFTDGDKGVMMLGVRNTAQNSYSASSDIANPIATDAYGNVLVLGNIAHDSADAGNPLKVGGKARTAEPSAVANNDRVDAYFDEYGYLMTKVSGGATEAKQDDIIANLPLNEVGRLKTSNLPASNETITGSITGNGQTVAFSVDRVSNVMAHCYGTFSTINVTFQGSLNSTDGSDGNWFDIQAVRTNANTVATTTGNLSAAPSYGWELSVNALKYMRVLSTAYTSGTQNWIFTLGSYATEPIPAIQTHAVTVGSASTSIGKAEDGASASGNVGVPPMIVRADSLSANAGVSANGDYAFMFCDNDGRVYTTAKITESALPTGAATSANQVLSLTPKYAVISASSSGDNTLIAAVAGKKIRVISGLLIANADVTVRFESGASGTALTGQIDLLANQGFQIPYCPLGNFETASNTLLNLELSAASEVAGWLTYIEV